MQYVHLRPVSTLELMNCGMQKPSRISPCAGQCLHLVHLSIVRRPRLALTSWDEDDCEYSYVTSLEVGRTALSSLAHAVLHHKRLMRRRRRFDPSELYLLAGQLGKMT